MFARLGKKQTLEPQKKGYLKSYRRRRKKLLLDITRPVL